MAMANLASSSLTPFTYVIAMEDDNDSKFFMDQYLSLLSPFSAAQTLSTIYIFDDTQVHPNIQDHIASTGSDSFTKNTVGDGDDIWKFDTTPSLSLSISSDSSPHDRPLEPVHTSPEPRKNSRTSCQPSRTAKKKKTLQAECGKIPTKRTARTVAMERNRIAATKSRLKSKSATDILVSTCCKLEEQYSALKTEHDKLFHEILELKIHILKHANCGEESIDIWVSDEAQRFAKDIGQ